MSIIYIILLILVNITICVCCTENDNQTSNYYCNVYYICKNNEYKMQLCKNNKVFLNNSCISQDEYKEINGEKCSKCPILINAMINGNIACNRLSHEKCCYNYDNKLIYCGYDNYWNVVELSKYIINCDHFIKFYNI
ncbi:unknown similar to AMEVITR04 [Adoxophyes honmai entomopoxvirus 'L']|uniref:Uncharacterized protein n=1 Tax=Adoxophyes honmai entomopoxvirus 'L' TaxID=1293540 RepID=A0A916KPB5_9POXV|nr:unknown similar to AMEVITR04 [Adoxophyes honmai entomopoxvirus 'L']CCU55554.1 unknown similar to AMEVITR04 [Adoxophyes honmai entomopoxvirus 'L']